MRRLHCGLSLLEIVLSTALLSGAFLLFSTLFGQVLRGTAEAGEMAEAVSLANARLSELESMVTSDSWDRVMALDGSQSTQRSFTVTTSIVPSKTYLPSRSSELAFEARGEERALVDATAQVEVRVRKGRLATSQVRLLRRPRQKLANPPIEFVNMPTSQIPRDGKAQIQARLVAQDGTTLSACFSFSLIPGSGYGSLVRHRNGQEVEFTNLTRDGSGSALYTGGTCSIKVSTAYYGEVVSVKSADLELAP